MMVYSIEEPQGMVLNYEATLNALICTFSSFYCNMYVFVYMCMIYIYKNVYLVST